MLIRIYREIVNASTRLALLNSTHRRLCPSTWPISHVSQVSCTHLRGQPLYFHSCKHHNAKRQLEIQADIEITTYLGKDQNLILALEKHIQSPKPLAKRVIFGEQLFLIEDIPPVHSFYCKKVTSIRGILTSLAVGCDH
jgi:hypothetical protein